MSISKTTKIALPCLLALGCSSSDKQANIKEKNDKERPNIVMFFTDDNALWYWGFGGGRDLSPGIDQLAAEGMECTQFYSSSPVCTPSRYNLHTGKFAGKCQHAAFRNSYPTNKPYCVAWNTYLDAEKERTMGEMFQEAGYKTGFVGKWHMGGLIDDTKDLDENFIGTTWESMTNYCKEKYGLTENADPSDPVVAKQLQAYQQDFIEYIKNTGYDYAASITPFNNDWHPVEAVRFHNLEWIAKGAMDFIDKRADDDAPFFLIVNITTHHGPCHRDALKTDVKVTQAGYVEGLEGVMPARQTVFDRIKEKGYPVDFKTTGTVWTDDCIGAVVEKLKEHNMIDNTAIVFTSDHNREEDGKGTCYQAGNHVPFIIKYKNVLPAGKRFNEPMQMTDLLPTFMSICDIDISKEKGIDGINMWPYMKREKYDADRTLYFDFGYSRAILDSNWKYIAFRLPGTQIENMKSGEVNKAYNVQGHLTDFDHPMLKFTNYFEPDQLYNLRKDPGEQVNLAYDKKYEEKLNEMKAKLKQEYLSRFEHPFPLEEVDDFYFTKQYDDLKEKARNDLHFEKYWWYSRGCY